MKTKMFLMVFFSVMLAQFSYASDVEKPYAKTLSVSKLSSETIDMTRRVRGEWMGWYDYLILRVPKKEDTLISARTHIGEFSAIIECNIISINQSPSHVVADIIVAFEPENDGGYQACDLIVTSGEPRGAEVTFELGAEVGE